MLQELPYDIKDPLSILEHARKLVGKSLRDMLDSETIAQENNGKGELGQLVERIHFRYECNPKPVPDFEEAGVELKTTPLKKGKNDYLIKERLVCGMIDYNEEYKHPFEESSFIKKCALLLLLFYIHEKNTKSLDLIFKYALLWKIPQKDLLIMKSDFDKIMNKIREGKAHQISEGDTLYLGACTKGTVTTFVSQPYAKEKARKRAFSLKPAYIRTILQILINEEDIPSITSEDELKKRDIENIIRGRFSPYIGKTETQLLNEFSLLNTSAKHKMRLLVHGILGAAGAKRIEEFEKAGIMMKVLRISSSGKCREHMSFPNINYEEILSEQRWEDSCLFDYFSKRFLFVIFKEDQNKEPRLLNILFWGMPNEDLEKAESFWQHVKTQVKNNDFDHFISIRDDKLFHVRPKARDAKDMATNPHGGYAPKKAYWMNKNYVENLLSEHHII